MWFDLIARISDSLAAASDTKGETLVAGICGAQGSGKSTLTEALADRLALAGKRVAVLSLDDLYLPRAARRQLAAQVHPLLATRGPPGTHNVALGMRTIAGLARSGRTRLPRFDKAQDDPVPTEEWPSIDGPADIVLFEGWCVGARPQPAVQLAQPVNALEREEDPNRSWRRFVHDALARDYQVLFAPVDTLILLAAPDFSVVARWRREQERKLRETLAVRGLPLAMTMDEEAIGRFIQHYERITRHVLEEMPARADLTIRLDSERNVIEEAGALLTPRQP